MHYANSVDYLSALAMQVALTSLNCASGVVVNGVLCLVFTLSSSSTVAVPADDICYHF
jgi:hypothetical protein